MFWGAYKLLELIDWIKIQHTEANAFAMPGKYILIHTGLITQSESAAEIAGVIAHELAHINRNHIEQNWQGIKS